MRRRGSGVKGLWAERGEGGASEATNFTGPRDYSDLLELVCLRYDWFILPSMKNSLIGLLTDKEAKGARKGMKEGMEREEGKVGWIYPF